MSTASLPKRAATNPIDAWDEARAAETMKKVEAKGELLFLPDNGDPKAGTTGYKACVYLDSGGKPTRRFQMGKPQSGQDKTRDNGGPYDVDLDENTCTCPFRSGVKVKNPQGEMVYSKEPETSCKHLYAGFYWLAHYEYELVAIKNVTNKKLVRWGNRKEK